MVPLFFFGPGTFFAKDVCWPKGIECRNPELVLVTLAQGRKIRGHLLLQKNSILSCVSLGGNPLLFPGFGKTKCRYRNPKSLSPKIYTWLSLGYPIQCVERVGFRIEKNNLKSERLVIEIITNGSISPRFALKTSRISIFNKGIAIYRSIERIQEESNIFKIKSNNFFKLFVKFLGAYTPNMNISIRIFYQYFDLGFFHFQEPIGLDLTNLELSKEVYSELRNIGFYTVGQLIETLAYKKNIISPFVKKQRQQSLFRLGMLILVIATSSPILTIHLRL
jgi:DNA-directed RNA polymerase alpha subunit